LNATTVPSSVGCKICDVVEERGKVLSCTSSLSKAAC
jgi:hypothetical protein